MEQLRGGGRLRKLAPPVLSRPVQPPGGGPLEGPPDRMLLPPAATTGAAGSENHTPCLTRALMGLRCHAVLMAIAVRTMSRAALELSVLSRPKHPSSDPPGCMQIGHEMLYTGNWVCGLGAYSIPRG